MNAISGTLQSDFRGYLGKKLTGNRIFGRNALLNKQEKKHTALSSDQIRTDHYYLEGGRD